MGGGIKPIIKKLQKIYDFTNWITYNYRCIRGSHTYEDI